MPLLSPAASITAPNGFICPETLGAACCPRAGLILPGFALRFTAPAGFSCPNLLIRCLLACRQCWRALCPATCTLCCASHPGQACFTSVNFYAACCPAGLQCRHVPLCGPATLQADRLDVGRLGAALRRLIGRPAPLQWANGPRRPRQLNAWRPQLMLMAACCHGLSSSSDA